MIARTGIHLIPRFELPHIGADADNRAGQIVPQYEGWPIGEKQLEFSIADLRIEKVNRGCVDANQYVVGTDFGIGHVDQTQRALFLVFVDDKGFHVRSPVYDGVMMSSQSARKATAFETNALWY